MKIKLPENYKLSKTGDLTTTAFYIYDIKNDVWSDVLTKLEDINILIANHEINLRNIEKISISKEYKIKIIFSLKQKPFHLYQGDTFQKAFDDIFELEKVANQKTEFNVKLHKLNNGEEIEI